MQTCEILLVEDNPADAQLVVMAMEQGRKVHVYHVQDGSAALDFLYRRGTYADSRRPDMVLLDLNLPKITGHEVLQQMKRDETLAVIPVVVLSSSSARKDVQRCYECGANAYMVKPSDLDALFTAVRLCRDYWMEVVTLASDV